MFAVALAFCGGVGVMHALPALLPWPVLLVAAATGLGLLPWRPALAAFCLGIVGSSLFVSWRLSADWPCSRDREPQSLTGVIAAPSILRPGRTDFDLAITESDSRDLAPGLARISWYRPSAEPEPGQFWRMTVRLRCRQGFANPGTADRELQLLRQRIGATGYVVKDDAQLLDDDRARRWIERLRARVAQGIEASLPPGPSVSVLQGLSVGLRGTVPDELWEAFATTGVAHLMAISGLHVTACALFVLLLLRGLWRWPRAGRLPARIEIECTVVVAVTTGYAWLSGASLPALRTLAMVAIVALQRLLRRQLPVHQTLALAAVLLCAADPLAISSAGFWLSFVATAALLAVLDSGPGLRNRVAGFARAQAAVTALLTPVMAMVFGRLSLIGPLANAMAIPLFGCVLLPAVLAATVLELLGSGAATGLWQLLGAALDQVWPWLLALGAWPIAGWAPPAQPAALVAGAGLLALAGLLLPLRGLRAAAAALLCAIVAGGSARPEPGSWTLTVLDVGQGLAAVVETHRHVLVFDSGPRWQGGGSAASVSLVPYLRSRGIRRIDWLIVSHPDQDHAGGVDVLERSFEIVQQSHGAIDAPAGDGLACVRGLRREWDGVTFHVVHPPADLRGSENDRSCALRVQGAGGSALLLADPEAKGEQALLAETIAADVVLLPHHGSRSSSSSALVDAAAARLGIASAGFGNRWGMPVAEVQARWRRAGTTLLTTAQSGAVTVRFSARPAGIVVETERGDAPRWWRRHSAGDRRGQRAVAHGIMPRHVGNHHRGRAGHVADPPVFGHCGRDHPRAPVDPAAQARHPA